MIVKFCDFCGVKLGDLYKPMGVTLDRQTSVLGSGPQQKKLDCCDSCIDRVEEAIQKCIQKKT
jgi:hypothetical protein